LDPTQDGNGYKSSKHSISARNAGDDGTIFHEDQTAGIVSFGPRTISFLWPAEAATTSATFSLCVTNAARQSATVDESEETEQDTPSKGG